MNETLDNINNLLSGKSSVPVEIKVETQSIIILSVSLIFILVTFFVCRKFI